MKTPLQLRDTVVYIWIPYIRFVAYIQNETKYSCKVIFLNNMWKQVQFVHHVATCANEAC